MAVLSDFGLSEWKIAKRDTANSKKPPSDPGQHLIPRVRLLSLLPPCVGGEALFELAGSVGGAGREGSRSSEGQRQPEWMAG